MRKNLLPIMVAILFTLGLIMATGVDANPIQAVYALALMGGALVCSKMSKRREQREKKKSNESIGGVIRDAA